MLSGVYPIYRIAAVIVLLAIANGLTRLRLADGVGVADRPSMVVSDAVSNAEADAVSNAEGAVVRSSRLLMGTTFNVSVWADDGRQAEAAKAIQQALDRVAELEGKISSWKSESETSAINRAAGRKAIRVGPEVLELLDVALAWAQQSDGALDITGGPLFDRWRRAREEGVLPTEAEITRCLELTGHQNVMRDGHTVRLAKPGMRIDFGAVGKGYAADRTAEFLSDRGFENYIVDAGGDILVGGSRGGTPWQVAIRHPRRHGFLAVYGASDRAIATSGDYEQFSVIDDVRYSHIIIPNTGWPAAHRLASVTVFARRGIDADALATALFVMGPVQGMEFIENLKDTETLMVLDDGDTRLSKGLHLNEGRLEIAP